MFSSGSVEFNTRKTAVEIVIIEEQSKRKKDSEMIQESEMDKRKRDDKD